LSVALVACDGEGVDPDAGGRSDAQARRDAGVDASSREDAGSEQDAGTDAGDPAEDAGPIACTIDADCPTEMWCRPTESGARLCVPFVGEGESCGGFSPVWASERCLPSLTCMTPSPLVADLPGICVIATTVAELVADIDGHLDHWVGIQDGYLRGAEEFAACTDRACPPEMPCCNECSTPLNFQDDAPSVETFIRLRTEAGMGIGCSGHECAPLSECDRGPNQRYRAIGVFREVYLSVHALEPYEFPPD
jgi:hypothetical protein